MYDLGQQEEPMIIRGGSLERVIEGEGAEYAKVQR